MHRVLYVEEILLNIFWNCCKSDGLFQLRDVKVLTALARTCKAFKEPALDVLWFDLDDLTSLVRCLPEVSLNSNGTYSLKRRLEQADWNIILSFTRRVRVCHPPILWGLTADCVQELSKPPSSSTYIFPNLLEIRLMCPRKETVPFLRHFAGPKLTGLALFYARELGDAIDIWQMCSRLTTFHYSSGIEQIQNPDRISRLICQWPKLRSVWCDSVTLNTAASIHLTHTPDLQMLHVELHDAVNDYLQSTPSSPSTITFPTLFFCDLTFQSLTVVGRFFDHLRLPVIEQLSIQLHTSPTELELVSFLAGLPGACNHKSLFKISVAPCSYFEEDMPPYHINFHHLRPLTVFGNIRILHLMIPCGVDLNERELLRLASSWPHLEVFDLGKEEFYPASTSITPGGFVQLLGRCRSLSSFSFVFDTHGYTHIPQGHPWSGLGMPKNRIADIRVLNSAIEEESVEALGNFFQVAPFPDFKLVFGSEYSDEGEFFDLYRDRWERVYSLAKMLWEERQKLLHSLKTRHNAVHDGYDSDDDNTGVN